MQVWGAVDVLLPKFTATPVLTAWPSRTPVQTQSLDPPGRRASRPHAAIVMRATHPPDAASALRMSECP